MMKTFKSTTKKASFWREVFSENGIGSSKRIIGTVMTMVALICIVMLTFREGGTNTVEGLLQTVIIVGSSLLGLSSITSIWKNGSTTIGKHVKKHKTKEEEPEVEENESDEEKFED